MASLRSSALLMLCGLAAASCSGPGDPCRSITCAKGRICDSKTGACMKDPNYVVPDAGSVVDAGTKGGGADAGTVPAACLAPPEASTDGGAKLADLSQATDELTGTCNSTPDSRETVYRVTLTQRSDFTARVTPLALDAGIDTVVYLRSSSCANGTEQVCVDNESDQSELLRARGLDAGTYFLVVEGFGLQGSGPVSVTSWATAPIPFPANDTCAAPQVIDLSSNSARITVDTFEAENDEGGSCGGGTGGGREVVYTFTLAATRTVRITSASADGGTAVDPVIYLRDRACGEDGGRELDCADAYLVPEDMTNVLPAGQYYLFVDSFTSASAGPTVVTVTVSP